jgi:hypothetical protein
MKRTLHILLIFLIALALFVGVIVGQAAAPATVAYAQQIFQNIISGRLTVINDSDLRGGVTVGGDLAVTGGLTSGGVSVSGGVVTIASETFVYDTLGVTSTLNVTGDANIDDLATIADLAVTEQLTVAAGLTTDDLTATDDATVADLLTTSDLEVTEQITTDDITVADLATVADLDVGEQLTVADGATIAGVLNLTPATTQVITDGDTLIPTGAIQPISSTAATGFGLITGPAEGNLLMVVNVGAENVVITETADIIMSGNTTLGPGDSVVLTYIGAKYYQLAPESDN